MGGLLIVKRKKIPFFEWYFNGYLKGDITALNR